MFDQEALILGARISTSILPLSPSVLRKELGLVHCEALSDDSYVLLTPTLYLLYPMAPASQSETSQGKHRLAVASRRLGVNQVS